VNGVSWAPPRFLMANYASLIAAYGLMLIYLRIKKNYNGEGSMREPL
jgi:hypothetical protein